MPRQKKDAKILNIKLATTISDQLEQFCEETGMSKTIATEKILSQYLAEYFNRPEQDRKLFKYPLYASSPCTSLLFVQGLWIL